MKWAPTKLHGEDQKKNKLRENLVRWYKFAFAVNIWLKITVLIGPNIITNKGDIYLKPLIP